MPLNLNQTKMSSSREKEIFEFINTILKIEDDVYILSTEFYIKKPQSETQTQIVLESKNDMYQLIISTETDYGPNSDYIDKNILESLTYHSDCLKEMVNVSSNLSSMIKPNQYQYEMKCPKTWVFIEKNFFDDELENVKVCLDILYYLTKYVLGSKNISLNY